MYLVQVPAARGRVIPDIDSISEDFPALCDPMTAIVGRSISAPTLDENENGQELWDTCDNSPRCSHSIDDPKDLSSVRTLEGIG